MISKKFLLPLKFKNEEFLSRYYPPYGEEEIFDLYITFFKRKNPKMLINKDWLRYTYNYNQTLIFLFLNIESVTYSGEIN